MPAPLQTALRLASVAALTRGILQPLPPSHLHRAARRGGNGKRGVKRTRRVLNWTTYSRGTACRSHPWCWQWTVDGYRSKAGRAKRGRKEQIQQRKKGRDRRRRRGLQRVFPPLRGEPRRNMPPKVRRDRGGGRCGGTTAERVGGGGGGGGVVKGGRGCPAGGKREREAIRRA